MIFHIFMFLLLQVFVLLTDDVYIRWGVDGDRSLLFHHFFRGSDNEVRASHSVEVYVSY